MITREEIFIDRGTIPYIIKCEASGHDFISEEVILFHFRFRLGIELFFRNCRHCWWAASPYTLELQLHLEHSFRSICLLITHQSSECIVISCTDMGENNSYACVLPVYPHETMWLGRHSPSPGCQPSVPSTSYITLTGHFTPGFRIPAERPPQTLWFIPGWWERHSKPAEHQVCTFDNWPLSRVCLTGEISYEKWFILFSPFHLESRKISSYGWFSSAVLVAWPSLAKRKAQFKHFRRCVPNCAHFFSLWKGRSCQRSGQHLSSSLEGLVVLWS